MKAYDYEEQIITDLNSIDNNSNNFYNYKKLSFLSKLNSKNQNIVISFHGSIPNKDKGTFDVIFRGYNYIIDNTDIICISDYLLSKYKSNYSVSWTLTTKKHSNTDLLYNELFKYIISLKNYKNIIFTGSSAGGFPSLKFSSFFKATAIISNSQLYIENYVNNYGLMEIKKYIDEDDEVIYKNKMIEEIILKSQPKKIIYYQNINDIGPIPHNSYKDYMQFKEFLNNNKLNNICDFIIFNDSNDKINPHSIQYPYSKSHLNILQEYIKNNNYTDRKEK